MQKTGSIFLGLALALLLLSASVYYLALILKSQANSYIAWAQQKNLTSPTSPTKNTKGVPTAESVYKSESLTLPTSVGTFVVLIANEAHESWQDEKHKLITDKNPYYIPKNLFLPQGTNITFLNADAPWDTPHPETIEVTDSEDGCGLFDWNNGLYK